MPIILFFFIFIRKVSSRLQGHSAGLIHVSPLSTSGHFNSLFAHFLAFGREFEILDPRDLRGLGVGDLADRWKEMGILEG